MESRIDGRADDHLRVEAAASWRNELTHFIGEEQQTDAIRVLDSRERENGDQFSGDVGFAPIHGAEAH